MEVPLEKPVKKPFLPFRTIPTSEPVRPKKVWN
jgi:hypothetical protein